MVHVLGKLARPWSWSALDCFRHRVEWVENALQLFTKVFSPQQRQEFRSSHLCHPMTKGTLYEVVRFHSHHLSAGFSWSRYSIIKGGCMLFGSDKDLCVL